MKFPKNVKTYVVIYDIFSEKKETWGTEANRRRAKIARLLLERGIRTQKSVFELEISSEGMKKLAGLLQKAMKENQDKIYIYPIEKKVKKKIKRIGEMPITLDNIFI